LEFLKPITWIVAFILISSSRIELVLQNFLSIGNLADPMTKLFLDSRTEIIREAAKNGFPGSGGEFKPRILSIYFTDFNRFTTISRH